MTFYHESPIDCVSSCCVSGYKALLSGVAE